MDPTPNDVHVNTTISENKSTKDFTDEEIMALIRKLLRGARTAGGDVAKDATSDIAKPLPNEHAARQNSPDKYKSIHRQNDKFGPGISVNWGILEDGKTEVQSIHFDASKFTPEEAKKWLVDHDYSAGSFEAAVKKDDDEEGDDMGTCDECGEETSQYELDDNGGYCNDCAEDMEKSADGKPVKKAFTDAPWSSPVSNLEVGAYCSVCLIDANESGTEKVKGKCHLPIRSRPGAPTNKAALRNAKARLNQVQGVSSDDKAKALTALNRLMSEAGMNVEKSRNVIDLLISIIHSTFTQEADHIFGSGSITQDERIALSGAIGDALDAFNAAIREKNLTGLSNRDPYTEVPSTGISKEWNANVLKSDEEKRIVYGVVYPVYPEGQGDTQNDVMKADEIEAMAHRFLIESQKYDLQHKVFDLTKDDVVVVESYIAPVNFEMNNHAVVKGSWVLATHFPSVEAWGKVKKGEIGAYSIRGKGKRRPIKELT